jgi:hypothetical protein
MAKAPSSSPGLFTSIAGLLNTYQLEDKGGYITQEFQDFGYRLALELNDLAHKSLYMRLAKKESRAMLEDALSFVSDAPSVKSKARLFMWKVKELKKAKVEFGQSLPGKKHAVTTPVHGEKNRRT